MTAKKKRTYDDENINILNEGDAWGDGRDGHVNSLGGLNLVG